MIPAASAHGLRYWLMFEGKLNTWSSAALSSRSGIHFCHEEGCIRRWCLTSNQFLGKNGNVTGVEVEEVEWIPATDGGRPTLKPTGKKEVIEADMVLLAMGFLKPEQPNFADNVFLAGDAATGASLVVRAMAGGRKTAAEIDTYLTTKN